MKLATIAVTIAVATSTINALDRCSIRLLTSITNSDEAKKCSDESGFSFLMATLTGSAPEPEQSAAICKSTSCQAVIQKLYTAVPTDCKLLNGKNLKGLTEEVVKQCPGASTTTALATVPDASKTATNESEAAPATDASKPAEVPTNGTVVVPSTLAPATNASEPVPSTLAPATNASEPVPTTDDSEAAPATDASKPVEAPTSVTEGSEPVAAPAPATNASEPVPAPAPAADDSEELPSDKENEEALNVLESKPTDDSEPAPAADDSEEPPATDASEPAAGPSNSAPVIVIVDNEPSDDSTPAPATGDSEPAPATNASQPAPATIGSQ